MKTLEKMTTFFNFVVGTTFLKSIILRLPDELSPTSIHQKTGLELNFLGSNGTKVLRGPQITQSGVEDEKAFRFLNTIDHFRRGTTFLKSLILRLSDELSSSAIHQNLGLELNFLDSNGT